MQLIGPPLALSFSLMLSLALSLRLSYDLFAYAESSQTHISCALAVNVISSLGSGKKGKDERGEGKKKMRQKDPKR